jgi:N-acetylmuramoyl-L-alanine amidase
MLNIIQKPSPNFQVGRGGYEPEIIVLHIAEGSLSSMDSWFANPVSQVSSHYGVGFKGEIHQYVQDEDTAWTQGRVLNPTFKLYKPGVNPNKYCLSIEHEGFDLSLVHETQINTSIELIKVLAANWNIPISRDTVIGHYEIFSGKPNCPATDKSIIDKMVLQTRESIKADIIRLLDLL